MLVHRTKRAPYTIQAPLTSLIDMVFMLLIYFLLTTNFMVDEGLRIKLPQAQASAPITREEITVYVDRDGRAFIRNIEYREDHLFKELKTLIAGQPGRLVMVKADRMVELNRAVKVMDLAKAAGAERLSLATEK